MDTMSAFDPNAFLQATISEAGSIISVPIPVKEYIALIAEVKARTWRSGDGLSSGMALDLVWDFDDAELKAFLGRPKVTLTQGIMVDLTTKGGLDMSKGKNVQLNRVRDAVGQNVDGQPWAPLMLQGKVAKVSVIHKPSERPQDPPGTVFANIGGVARVA